MSLFHLDSKSQENRSQLLSLPAIQSDDSQTNHAPRRWYGCAIEDNVEVKAWEPSERCEPSQLHEVAGPPVEACISDITAEEDDACQTE